MKIAQDPVTKLWCREDGAVLMPPSGRKFPRFRWTFGCPTSRGGYRVVQPKGKLHYVHGIVARTFIPNPDNLPTVDHFPDRNPANNSVDNLRWADMKMQTNNRQICEDSAAKYGVRECEDPKAYQKAYDAAYNAKMKAAGFVKRKCPDGKWRWIKP